MLHKKSAPHRTVLIARLAVLLLLFWVFIPDARATDSDPSIARTCQKDVGQTPVLDAFHGHALFAMAKVPCFAGKTDTHGCAVLRLRLSERGSDIRTAERNFFSTLIATNAP
jgi:hypothetical protein